MTDCSSAIYFCSVTHTRVRPRRHHLRYRLYSLLLDLDELPRVDAALRLFSHNKFNLFSFYDRDFGDGGPEPLRDQVVRHLVAAGIEADGPVRVLAMPRVLGHAFNPISIFFCLAPDGTPRAILYEVHNTFGERHSYLARVAAADVSTARQECAKDFHVSPFMDMDMKYRFRVKLPGDDVRIAITGSDKNGGLISAIQEGRRANMSDATLARAFFSHPFVTLKVVAAIHFEAVKLWLKGIGVRSKPPAPATFVTHGRPVARN